jgi:hypothetical protein
MKYILVQKKIGLSWQEDKIEAYHYLMFHGEESPKQTRIRPNNIGDNEFVPLILDKNVYSISNIFKTGRNFIISWLLKDKIENKKIENISFLQVTFDRLYKRVYEAGSQKDMPCDYYEMLKEIAETPDEPSLHETISPYYELLTPKLSDVQNDYPTYTWNTKSLLNVTKNIQINIPYEKYHEYPVLWSPEGILMNEDFYSILAPYFDWTYFMISEVII